LKGDEGNQIFSNLTKLQFLYFDRFFLSDCNISQWITKLVNLQCFVFEPYDVDDEDFIALMKSLSSLPNLTEFHISHLINSDTVWTLDYLSTCSNLKSLTFDNLSFAEEEFQYITSVTHLTQLKFWNSWCTDGAPYLAKLTNLKSFGNHGKVLDNKEIITTLTNLENLHLRFWTDGDINTIQTSMPHLTSITIEYAPNDNIIALTCLSRLPLIQVATAKGLMKPNVVEELQRIPNVQIVTRYDYDYQYLESYEAQFLVKV